MIIDSLAVKNFLGYKRQLEVLLGDKQAIGIVGPNEAGKSTLLQAISYGIYGKTRAEREIQLINDSADGDLVVELRLVLADGGSLEITRGRTKKNERVLQVGQLRGDEAHAHILDRVGICHADFLALSYFVQGDIHQFMTGDKRAYFQRWTASLHYWELLEAEAKAWAREVEADHQATLRDIANAKESLGHAKELRRQLDLAADTVAKCKERAAVHQEQVVTLQVKLRAEKGTSNLDEELVRLQSEVDDLGEREASLAADIYRLESEANDIKIGKCPILGCKCPPLTAKGKARRNAIEEEAAQLRRKRTAIVKRLDEAEDAVKELEAKVEHSTQPMRRVQLALAEAKRQLSKAQDTLHRAVQHHAKLRVRYEEARRARRALRASKGQEREQAATLRRINFLRFMCGRSGVPSRLIEAELARVEDKCNWILDRLDYPKQIRFRAFKELTRYEQVCPACGGEVWRGGLCVGCGAERPRARKDEPTVTVVDGSVERPFALESGGAQVLQSFAVRLAGSLFVASMMGVKVSMVMLDEVFAMLDASNRQKLMNLVVDKLSTEFGLSQQLIVSHQEDIINTVDNILVVRKERGSSVAKWA